jgi:hypothetical protein
MAGSSAYYTRVISALALASLLVVARHWYAASTSSSQPPTVNNNATLTKASLDAKNNGGLVAIVTGLEHSGTTLMGRLLNNAPCVIGAYETGFLLAETPRDIDGVHPWYVIGSYRHFLFYLPGVVFF